MGVTVRVAHEADMDRLVEIHRSAFPDPRGGAERERNFVANPRGDLGCLHVAERDGRLVGHAFLFSMTGHFGGRPVALGGVASVGVAPEARGGGVARALLHALHDASRARGDAATLLYAFRQGFYAACGYAPTSSYRRLVVAPRAVPRAWGDPAITIRAAEGGDRAALEATYARAASRGTGWLARPAALWDALLLREPRVWFLAERAGQVVGYVAWRAVQSEAHAAVDLEVDDLVADDEGVRRALFALLGRQRDQVRSFRVAVDADDPIDRALLDADAHRFGDERVEHSLGEAVAGPMVRILDVHAALGARGYRGEGEIALAVRGGAGGAKDEVAGARMTVRRGVASVAPLAEDAVADIETDRATLGAVLYGGLAPSDAARLGTLRARDATALAQADAILALPPFFTVDAF